MGSDLQPEAEKAAGRVDIGQTLALNIKEKVVAQKGQAYADQMEVKSVAEPATKKIAATPNATTLTPEVTPTNSPTSPKKQVTVASGALQTACNLVACLLLSSIRIVMRA